MTELGEVKGFQKGNQFGIKFKKGHIPWNKDKPWSNEIKRKISESHKKPENIKKAIQNLPKDTSGSKNGRWLGGISYFRGPDWKKIRIKCWQRDGFICQECGKNNCKVIAHHIIPYRISEDNSLKNLITICMSCHQKIHGDKYY